MINPYNIPWPDCWCPECSRYGWDEDYRNEIERKKREQFERLMSQVLTILEAQ